MISDAAQTPTGPAPRRRLVRLGLRLVFSLLVFFVMLEISLRLAGFEHLPYIARVRHNQSIAIIAEFNRDPYLIWAPKPGTPPFNSQGYIGPELPRQRTPGTIRIACVGDSCTQIGSPAYPEIVGRMLDERGYDGVEVMNWGVAGYSSFQGLTRMERDVIAYRPDITTIYFGWNDHWIRAGMLDDPAAIAATRIGPIRQTIEETRTAQAVMLLADSLGRRKDTIQFRVPLPAYRDNLRHMIQLAHSSGSRVLLITAPGCLIDDRAVESLLKGLNSLGYSSAASVHADYLQATHDIAAETNTDLCDTARYFDESIHGCDYFLPHQDPIHLTQPGLEIIAEQLTEELIRLGWLESDNRFHLRD